MKNQLSITQIFISHARNDYALANALTKELRSRGFNVWDDKNIKKTKNCSYQIEKALKNSDAMIALLNQHSYSSSYVRDELEYALFSEDYKNRLLPVFIESSKETNFIRLPWILTNLEYLKISETKSLDSMANIIANKFIAFLRNKESDR